MNLSSAAFHRRCTWFRGDYPAEKRFVQAAKRSVSPKSQIFSYRPFVTHAFSATASHGRPFLLTFRKCYSQPYRPRFYSVNPSSAMKSALTISSSNPYSFYRKMSSTRACITGSGVPILSIRANPFLGFTIPRSWIHSHSPTARI